MEKYTLGMRIMHWVMTVLILTLLAVGLYMTSLPNDYPGKFDIYAMHKSFGIIALALVLLRLILRMSNVVPALPIQINARDTKLHNSTVLLLYVGMLIVPIAGYVMSVASGRQVSVFGWPVPSLLQADPGLATLAHTIHVNGWYILLAVIVLHLAGNTKHYLVEKVNLLSRMW